MQRKNQGCDDDGQSAIGGSGGVTKVSSSQKHAVFAPLSGPFAMVNSTQSF